MALLAVVVAVRTLRPGADEPETTATATPAASFVPRSQPSPRRSSAEPTTTISATATATATATASAGAGATRTTPAPAPEPSPAGDFLFTMPDLIGVRLQTAQNTVQGLGVFLSRSHDLRGSRQQLIDRNWRVCNQAPAAGTRLFGSKRSLEGKIDFGVVKTGEDCPSS